MTTATSIDQTIADFAARVRRRLDDLPDEEIEDLTEGLEADLTEKALDEELGDPDAYATELRSAAGLPPRAAKSVMPWSIDSIRLLQALAASRIRRNRIAGAVLDFAIILRPAWWMLRAWAAFELAILIAGGRGIVSALPDTPFRWFIFAALAIVSVQWGRNLWLPRWMNVVRDLVNVMAILALPFLLTALASSSGWAYAQSVNVQPEPAPAGLTRNGGSVTNIFAYDADGAPITGVQLFDQNGKPLSAKPPGEDFTTMSDGRMLVPSTEVTNGNGWNVYPLESIPLNSIDNMTGRPRADATATPVQAPFARVQPLLTPPPLRDGSGVTPAPAASNEPPASAEPPASSGPPTP
ncbi:hypothetical protein F1C58_13340 [Glaciihabitans sp. INWT7]|uniref:hypothetical protein n=1 Tax=Glaciihabitans sp. INWT7 TaxID=2596912 RepID=UPI0016287810|nr:hypothetical protein [Glaciihabitans sp. INWT7]QNE47783.1 hypothetical protein F1C58_13340 [Glaciihabitans sp. INWT7]